MLFPETPFKAEDLDSIAQELEIWKVAPIC